MTVAEGKYKADPGIGRDDAPIGSESWAQAVRLHLQAIVKDIDSEPKRVQRYVDLINEHRAWTLMNRPDGSYFGTWEDFCEFRQPWGLGRAWAELRPFIEAAVGKRALDLATVAPAKSPPGKAEDKGPEAPLLSTRSDKRHRAIAERAPEPVRELYRDGLIGTKEAAALGPKNPTPEEAAKVTAVAIEARDVARAEKPKTEREKRTVQKKVNTVVRAGLGREADPVKVAVNALAKVPFQHLAVFVSRLPDNVRRTLRMILNDGGPNA